MDALSLALELENDHRDDVDLTGLGLTKPSLECGRLIFSLLSIPVTIV